MLQFIQCLLSLPFGVLFSFGSLFCGVFLGVLSRLAIILLGKEEVVALF